LSNVFNSTIQNNYFYQATPSRKLFELSKAQSNCIVYSTNNKQDTLYAPTRNDVNPLWVGDLRLASVYSTKSDGTTINDGNPTTSSLYSSARQTISKLSTGHVLLYRRGQIYLRFAEAMNRAGFPESAFAILKYGLYQSNIDKYVDPVERSRAGILMYFSQYLFTPNNTLGIHSRGSGDAFANKNYVIPELPNQNDSINYVEDLICDETALETSFEGCRFFDLVRMALHRDDNLWLAQKIAERNGPANFDADLYKTVKERESWFLPLK